LRGVIESLLIAVQFLTRLPTPATGHLAADRLALRLRQSVIWFPAVGGLVGVISAVTLVAADLFWPRIVAIALMLIVEARVTGGFHEDAVADFCDGMGGGRTSEDKLRIMKDSRIGSYGSLGLMLGLGLRAALLATLPAGLLAPALIASAVLGRWTSLVVMAAIPAIPGRDGLASQASGAPRWWRPPAALILAAPFWAWAASASPFHLIVATAASLIMALGFARYLDRRLGGSTGDCLGFICFVGQLLTLLIFSARLP
jgi:adenosylcobinamide-GDP ribazoletransferase